MSLEMLFKNRANEFEEIANAIDLRTDTLHWKKSVLDFSLQFHDCLTAWNNVNSENDEIRKCNNIMTKISRRKGVSQMLQLLYVINKIAEDFKTISKN